jgi:NADH:ubiquinone oxidoreductase subunit D
MIQNNAAIRMHQKIYGNPPFQESYTNGEYTIPNRNIRPATFRLEEGEFGNLYLVSSNTNKPYRCKVKALVCKQRPQALFYVTRPFDC